MARFAGLRGWSVVLLLGASLPGPRLASAEGDPPVVAEPAGDAAHQPVPAANGAPDDAASGDAAAGEPAEPAEADEKMSERLARAARVLEEVLATPDKSIPQDLLDGSTCVIVIPSMKKAGLGIGGRYGRGAVSCRRARGEGPWGPPSMVMLAGGSVGFQIGFAAVDLVLLVMNADGIDDLLRSKFTLGGDASVAAGPVGRSASAQTDARMGAKILAWSRSRGVFAGLELEGAVLKQDREANEKVYGTAVEARKLLLGAAPAIPESAQEFVRTLDRHSPRRTRKPL